MVEFIRKIIASVLSSAFFLVGAGSALGFTEELSTIPFIGVIWKDPFVTICLIVVILLLTFRGNFLSKLLYGWMKPAK